MHGHTYIKSETCRGHLWEKIIVKLFASSWYIFLTQKSEVHCSRRFSNCEVRNNFSCILCLPACRWNFLFRSPVRMQKCMWAVCFHPLFQFASSGIWIITLFDQGPEIDWKMSPASDVPGQKHKYINPLVPNIRHIHYAVWCLEHQMAQIADGLSCPLLCDLPLNFKVLCITPGI